MYTITGLNNLIQWFANSGNTYWKAFDNDRGARNAVGSNFKDEKPTQDDAIRSIKAFLELYSLNGCRLYFWSVDKISNSNGGFFTWFEMAPMVQQNAISGTPQAQNNYNEQTIEERVKKAIEEFQREQKIKDLENQLAELNEQLDSPLERIAGRLEPAINLIADRYFGKKQISGTTATQNKTVETREDNLRRSLERLANQFENIDEILEKLADKSEENPELINNALTFL